jgi:hypothetical protein
MGEERNADRISIRESFGSWPLWKIKKEEED